MIFYSRLLFSISRLEQEKYIEMRMQLRISGA